MTVRRAFRVVLSGCMAILLTLLILLADPGTGFAAMVRGKLQRGTYPAPYVTVTLLSQVRGRSAPAITSADGMYHLYNVPAGQYTLELWLGGSAPMIFTIVVHEPYTDIAPIHIP